MQVIGVELLSRERYDLVAVSDQGPEPLFFPIGELVLECREGEVGPAVEPVGQQPHFVGVC